jgi:hypothetical protein
MKGAAMKFSRQIMLAGVLISSIVTGLFAQTNWTWRYPLPQGHHLQSIVWTGTQLVAVGDYGTIMTSTDAVAWTLRNSGTTRDLRSVAWSSSMLAVVGYSNKVLTSTDGITWTSRTFSYDYDSTVLLCSVKWTGSQFVAVGGLNKGIQGEFGYDAYSTDGITWYGGQLTSVGAMYSVAKGDSIVAVGRDGIIRTSTNLSAWTTRVAGSGNSLKSVIWTGTQFVAVGEGNGCSSPNGVTWSGFGPNMSSNYYYSIIWTGSQYVAVGTSTSTSPDGTTWTDHASGTKQYLRSVAWTGTQLVAVGDFGTILTSPDGAVWTSRGAEPTVNGTQYLNSVAFGASKMVAVGCNGPGSILTSTDGIAWTKSSDTTTLLASVIWANSQFVAINISATGGPGKIVTSPDAVTWTTKYSGGTKYLSSVNWTGGMYIAVGDSGTILTSPDAATWTPQTSGTLKALCDVTRTDSLFVAVGDTVLTSPDAITWTVRPVPRSVLAQYNLNMQSVVWTGSQLVATAENGNPNNGSIFTSPDGKTWTIRRYAQDSYGCGKVLWTGTQLIVVGGIRGSTVLVSLDGITWVPKPLSGWLCSIGIKNNVLTGVGWHETIMTSPQDAVVPQAPVLVSPKKDTTGVSSSQTLQWNAVADALLYRVQASADSTFATTIRDSTLAGTSTAINAAGYHTTFYWRVNAKNAVGAGAWSEKWAFTTKYYDPYSPFLLTPLAAALVPTDTVVLCWRKAIVTTGVDKYLVEFSTDSLMASSVVADSAVMDTVKTVKSLVNNTSYWWRVKMHNVSGWGPYSTETRKFTVTLTPVPSKIVLLSPANDSTVTADSVVFVWQKATGSIDKYCFEYATDSLMSNGLTADSMVTDTTKKVKALQNATKYWWRVRAHNNLSGWGQYSDKRSLTVNIPTSVLIPKDYSCSANGMSRSGTFIRYGLPKASLVTIKLYSIQGKLLKIIGNSYQQPGYYRVSVGISNLSSGNYVLEFKAGSYTVKKRLLHL